MEDAVIQYYMDGQNCAQCLLMAAGEETAGALCAGLGRGFGFGGLCGAAIAGAMLAARGDKTATETRAAVLWLMTELHARHGSLDCAVLRAKHGDDCEGLIREVTRLVEAYAD